MSFRSLRIFLLIEFLIALIHLLFGFLLLRFLGVGLLVDLLPHLFYLIEVFLRLLEFLFNFVLLFFQLLVLRLLVFGVFRLLVLLRLLGQLLLLFGQFVQLLHNVLHLLIHLHFLEEVQRPFEFFFQIVLLVAQLFEHFGHTLALLLFQEFF